MQKRKSWVCFEQIAGKIAPTGLLSRDMIAIFVDKHLRDMKYDVFISYSTCDQKVADDICAYLEKNGIKCFIASRDIPAGEVFADCIVNALEESMMMVVVCSDNCNRSKQVSRELELASEDGKLMLPFRIDNAPLKGAKKYYLKNRNWIDAFPKPEEHFEILCQDVRKLLGIKEDNGPTDAVEQLRLGDKYAMTQDWAQAIKWYHKSSEQGNAAENGDVVPKDLVQAVELYRKSAEQGNAAAQNNLGVCYEYGAGVPENLEQAEYWYRKSAEQGNVNARKALDRLTK